MAYRDADGRIHVGHTDCPTEHAIMVRDFCRDEAMAEEYQRQQFEEAQSDIQAALDVIAARTEANGPNTDDDGEIAAALMEILTITISEYDDLGIVARSILHPVKRAVDEANILLEAWRHITGSESAISQSQ